MTTSGDLFAQAASWIVEETTLTEPQARGSLRLALKQGGCNAKDVTPHQLTVIFRSVMPKVLQAQGVSTERAQTIAEQVAVSLEKMTTSNRPDDAAFMFDRVDRETRK
jgi:hypothetical protein